MSFSTFLRPRKRRGASSFDNQTSHPQPTLPVERPRHRRLMLVTVRLSKRMMILVFVIVALLAAANPFFVNFFEEVNYIFHKCSIVGDFLLLKRRQKPNDKIIYYLHLSKTAGTSFMDAAKRNGLSVPVRNGLTQRDWRCCGGKDTLEAQEAFFNTSKFDFVANENDMYDAMDTNHYDYVVTLRNSRARYLSMWAQWQRDPVMAYANPMNFTAWCRWFYEDNFMLRKICGSRCREKPKYSLTRDDFEYTLKRLQKFDSIMFMEDFAASYAKFAKKHGWKSPINKIRISPPVKGRLATLVNQVDDSDWDYQESALDDAVYEYALRIDGGMQPYDGFSRPTRQHLETYFAKQKK
ncbi:expressed unknown protein [Seminavis robusta]|uniref:Uncharacterized protein n=1 Tax=Seminavis robusta TaxID=568900 RepID=A0A9N8HFN5_9STRA|nr:expressed unknown protein [Seminavis robusta]|eukprot:Sro533_g161660.1 n/a (352) ;mRNA; r:33913-34968